jgi:hypothetical protein
MMGGSGWCDFAAYARRSKGLEVLIPILYLKGVSTGDFEEALLALLGKDAGGLSASTVGRLKDAWSDEHARWSRRDLSAKRAPRGGSTKRIGSFAAMQELARPEGVDVAGSKTTDFMLESVRALDSQAFSRWFFSKGQCSAKWRHCIS